MKIEETFPILQEILLNL